MMSEPVAPVLPPNPIPDLGGGGGAVASVNGEVGHVVLDADDVGAATAAQGALADTAIQSGDLGSAASAATTDFASAALVSGNGLGIVNHGATAGTARPSGFAQVLWVGSADPTNKVAGDLRLNTA